MWRVPENEIFFFSKEPIVDLEDFHGLKVRSFGGALSDMIDGMGSEAQWVAFAEVYTALERGILDGGVTGANAAYGQRWYEVADYMAGPLPLFTVENATFNPDVWNGLPPDFQAILMEEGAKYELEFFRVTPILSALGIPKLLDEGMVYTPFSDEIRTFLFEEVALKRVVPQWVNRVGGPRHGRREAVQQDRRTGRGNPDQSRRQRVSDRELTRYRALTHCRPREHSRGLSFDDAHLLSEL